MTPDEMDILMHHHISPDRHPRFQAPTVRSAITKFLDDGIFERRQVPYTREFPNIYRLTEKGHAWLTLILGTPCPVPSPVWVDPRTGMKVEGIV